MNNDKVTVYPRQDGITFSVETPKAVADRAAEITKRNPKEDWFNRGLDLLEKARQELQAEGKLPKKE